ncbi:MAG: family 1 glycosylhydrolase, partial [Gammaproteobacteria bacterium]|nr:family 1 glycosylhydrolase [Gammaproteobacteria bacterium]
PITPGALYWGPKFFYERYQMPIVITECGMANNDSVQNGIVIDGERIAFLSNYLNEYERAIVEGVPALGFFLWSLLDNFEWAEGYSKRFGIVYVDYETQQRSLKYSAYWYKAHIASQRSSRAKDAIAAVANEPMLNST